MFENYKILPKIIGKGTLAIVYEAIGLLDSKPYCAKFVDKKKDPNKRYLAECDILEECTAKGIEGVVKIFARSENENYYISILEYIPKSISLDKFSKRDLHKHFIAEELISIVKELHKHSIFHIDIKPRNIIVSKDKTMIIDFDTAIRTEIKSDILLGSMNYVAPEGLNGIYGSFTDLYSLGLTLVYIFTGKDRFEIFQKYVDTKDQNAVKKFAKEKETHDIIEKEILILLHDSVDDSMKSFIMSAMCYNYKDRYLN